MHGELWRAVSREAIPAGAHVRVTSVEGLTLHVCPASTRRMRERGLQIEYDTRGTQGRRLAVEFSVRPNPIG